MYFFVLPCSRSRSSDIAYLISLPTSDLQVLKDHVVLVRVFSQIIELHQPHHSASFHYIPSVHLESGQSHVSVSPPVHSTLSPQSTR